MRCAVATPPPHTHTHEEKTPRIDHRGDFRTLHTLHACRSIVDAVRNGGCGFQFNWDTLQPIRSTYTGTLSLRCVPLLLVPPPPRSLLLMPLLPTSVIGLRANQSFALHPAPFLLPWLSQAWTASEPPGSSPRKSSVAPLRSWAGCQTFKLVQIDGSRGEKKERGGGRSCVRSIICGLDPRGNTLCYVNTRKYGRP